MDIEAIVKKHFDRWVTDTEFGNVEVHLRAALTEQAARYEQKIAGLEKAWQAAKSASVVGEAVAEAYVYEDVDGDDILGLRLLKEDYPMQHGEKLYTAPPATSITQAELDAKDARIRELEEANASLEASYRGSCMMYDATKVELKALRRCKELLAEARDDVSEQLNHMLPLAGYPSNDKRISKQRELLAAIDAAIAQGKEE